METKQGAITLDLSTAGRPWGRGKTRRRPRRTSWQEDRQEGGRVGEEGNYGAGTSPAGALAHEPCCHTKGGSFRVGLKDGGRGRGIYCGGPWIWGWQNCTSRAQKLEPNLLVKVHSASAPWLNHCRSQCNIRLAAEIDIVIFEWQQEGVGKQRLSNSCLKTGAGKAKVQK